MVGEFPLPQSPSVLPVPAIACATRAPLLVATPEYFVAESAWWQKTTSNTGNPTSRMSGPCILHVDRSKNPKQIAFDHFLPKLVGSETRSGECKRVTLFGTLLPLGMWFVKALNSQLSLHQRPLGDYLRQAKWHLLMDPQNTIRGDTILGQEKWWPICAPQIHNGTFIRRVCPTSAWRHSVASCCQNAEHRVCVVFGLAVTGLHLVFGALFHTGLQDEESRTREAENRSCVMMPIDH